jgi:hypothetical protein
MHYLELGLVSSATLRKLMVPSEKAGSMKRFVLRVASAGTNYYYLVKEVDDKYGDNELRVGRVLRTLVPGDAFIPAVGGIRAPGSETPQSIFVLVPWKHNTTPLNSFIQDGMPAILGLSTSQILIAFYPLLMAANEAFKRARFLHMYCKANQILVSKTLPLTLHLVDFGHSAVDAIIHGEHIRVQPHTISGTSQTFQEESYNLMVTLHLLVAASSPNKDVALIREWNLLKIRVFNMVHTIVNVCEWLQQKFPNELNPATTTVTTNPATTTVTTNPATTTTTTTTTTTGATNPANTG